MQSRKIKEIFMALKKIMENKRKYETLTKFFYILEKSMFSSQNQGIIFLLNVCVTPQSGVASGYSRYSVNILQFPLKKIINFMLG